MCDSSCDDNAPTEDQCVGNVEIIALVNIRSTAKIQSIPGCKSKCREASDSSKLQSIENASERNTYQDRCRPQSTVPLPLRRGSQEAWEDSISRGVTMVRVALLASVCHATTDITTVR